MTGILKLFYWSGLILPRKNKEIEDTVKYSIWNTRTDKDQPGTKEKYTKSFDRSNLESKTADNQE
jgi:hypothetical protein